MSGFTKAFVDFISTINCPISKKLRKGTLNGAGHRLFPPRSSKDDKKFNFRIHQGHVYDEAGTKFDIVVQPNAESRSPAIKKLITKIR